MHILHVYGYTHHYQRRVENGAKHFNMYAFAMMNAVTRTKRAIIKTQFESHINYKINEYIYIVLADIVVVLLFRCLR